MGHQAAKNVAVIFTGGTIGAEDRDGQLDVPKDENILLDTASAFCSRRNYILHAEQPFSMISEDMSPNHWVRLAESVKALVDNGHKSIVITHGTDTLAYSAAVIDMLFNGNEDLKIVLTGAFYSLEHPQSDAELNLSAALIAATSKNLASGVYVAFGDSANSVPIMAASNVKPMQFDGRQFSARYDDYVGRVLPTVGMRNYSVSPLFPQEKITLTYPDGSFIPWAEVKENIVQFFVYPGFEMDSIAKNMVAGSVVLLSPYHSGTAPSLGDDKGLLKAIEQRPDIDFIITPFPDRYVNPPYASTVRLMDAGAKVYADLMTHSVYVAFVLGAMAGVSKETVLELLSAWEI